MSGRGTNAGSRTLSWMARAAAACAVACEGREVEGQPIATEPEGQEKVSREAFDKPSPAVARATGDPEARSSRTYRLRPDWGFLDVRAREQSDARRATAPDQKQPETGVTDPLEPVETAPEPVEIAPSVAPETPPVLPAVGAGWGTPPPFSPWFDDGAVPPALPEFAPHRPGKLLQPDYRPWTSGHSIVVNGDEIAVADTDNGQVVILNALDGTVLRKVPVGARPEQLVVGADGTLFVTVRGDGVVARTDPDASVVAATVPVGAEPIGIAFSPDRTVLFVASHQAGTVTALDPATFGVLAVTSVTGHPRALGVTPDGMVAVADQFGTSTQFPFANGSFGSKNFAHLRRQNPADLAYNPGILGSAAATRALSLVVAPTGFNFVNSGRVMVPHVIARPGTEDVAKAVVNGTASTVKTEEQVDCPPSYYGSACTTTLIQIETVTRTDLIRPIDPTVTVVGQATVEATPTRDPLTGSPMTEILDQPGDVAHHPTRSLLFVVGTGSDNVLVLATNTADPMTAPVAELKVGRGPRGIALSDGGEFAYVLDGTDFAVSRVPLADLLSMPAIMLANGKQGTVVKTVYRDRVATFGVDPLSPLEAAGRRTFTFARAVAVSGDGRFACNTCHVDGLDDKLVWFGNEGERQTPAIAGRLHDTAPFNWKGTKPTLEENIDQTIKRLGGAGLDAATMAPLAAFVRHGLPVPPNPNLAPEGLTLLQAAGEELFESPEVGCSGCHAGPALTDGGLHDVGTLTTLEALVLQKLPGVLDGPALNTPTLRHLHATAPYLHDGSAATLGEVLAKTANTMGHSGALTVDERSALLAYLATL